MTQFNNIYMQLALKEAKSAEIRGEIPIGAVIVDNNNNIIIAAQGNRMIEKNDPTAHAEILAIRQACEKQSNLRLDNCSLYSTLEPCPMCAQAIALSRIENLYFAAEDKKAGGVYHGAKIFEQSSCNHKPTIYNGILEQESSQMLSQFFANLRNK